MKELRVAVLLASAFAALVWGYPWWMVVLFLLAVIEARRS